MPSPSPTCPALHESHPSKLREGRREEWREEGGREGGKAGQGRMLKWGEARKTAKYKGETECEGEGV